MRFISLAELTAQTLVIVPRLAGQVLRLGATEVVTVAETPARVYGTGTVEISEGYWDDCTIVAGEYAGPPFNGASGGVEFVGGMKVTRWEGEPHNSASSTFVPPVTESVDVLRSLDAGETWEVVQRGLPSATNLEDAEALSFGQTMYRAISYAAGTGASAYSDITVEADSTALWLGGGEQFGLTARLPFSPEVSIESGRERSVQRYEGRSRGVAYAGEQLTRVVRASGSLICFDDENASLGDLEAISQAEDPLHLYRDPDGRRIYGMLSSISLPRQAGSPGGDIWGWSFQLDETDR